MPILAEYRCSMTMPMMNLCVAIPMLVHDRFEYSIDSDNKIAPLFRCPIHKSSDRSILIHIRGTLSTNSLLQPFELVDAFAV